MRVLQDLTTELHSSRRFYGGGKVSLRQLSFGTEEGLCGCYRIQQKIGLFSIRDLADVCLKVEQNHSQIVVESHPTIRPFFIRYAFNRVLYEQEYAIDEIYLKETGVSRRVYPLR